MRNTDTKMGAEKTQNPDRMHILVANNCGGWNMRLCELEDKSVINVVDGRSLGCVTDLQFDPKCGQIEALIVPGPGKCFGLFGREFELVIPWKCICQIGPDVVLVQIEVDKCKHKG